MSLGLGHGPLEGAVPVICIENVPVCSVACCKKGGNPLVCIVEGLVVAQADPVVRQVYSKVEEMLCFATQRMKMHWKHALEQSLAWIDTLDYVIIIRGDYRISAKGF